MVCRVESLLYQLEIGRCFYVESTMLGIHSYEISIKNFRSRFRILKLSHGVNQVSSNTWDCTCLSWKIKVPRRKRLISCRSKSCNCGRISKLALCSWLNAWIFQVLLKLLLQKNLKVGWLEYISMLQNKCYILFN